MCILEETQPLLQLYLSKGFPIKLSNKNCAANHPDSKVRSPDSRTSAKSFRGSNGALLVNLIIETDTYLFNWFY